MISKLEIEKKVYNKLRQAHFLEEEIHRHLLELPRQENHSRFFSAKEQAFFHWQKKFLDGLDVYLSELSSFDEMRLWLLLLEQKSGAHPSGRFSKERAGYLAKRIQRIHHKKIAVVRAIQELQTDAVSLARELNEWEVTRANREAAGSFADLRTLLQERGSITLGGYFKRFGRYLCAVSYDYFRFRGKSFLFDQKQQNEKLKKLAFKI